MSEPSESAGQGGQVPPAPRVPTEAPPAPPRRRHWSLRAALWLAAAALVLSAALVLAALALTGRPLTAPDWVTDRVETRVNAALEGTGRLRIDRIVLQVSQAGVPRISLRDVRLYDAGGAEVAQLNDMGAALSVEALRERRLQPDTLRLAGAQAVLRRRADGRFDLSFGGGGNASTGDLATALAEVEKGFAEGPLSEIRRIVATDLTLSVEDARSRRIWQVTGGTLELENAPGAVEVTADFEVFNGTEDLAATRITFTRDKRSGEVRIAARFENAAAGDIAAQSPALAFLGLLEAPISGAVRGALGPDGTLASLDGSLEIGAGALTPGGAEESGEIAFDGARAYFAYDPAEQRLSFSELSFRSGAGSINASGQAYLREFREGWPGALLGQFTLSDMRLDPPGLFAEPVDLASGAVDFRLRLDPFSLDIGQLVLRDGGERLIARGGAEPAAGGWHARLDLEMASATKERVLALWPPALIPKTRKWLTENVRAGELRDIRAAIRLAPGEAPVTSLGWNIADAEVRYIKTLPPIRDASGYATIQDHVFTLVVEEGEVEAPQGGAISAAGSVVRIKDVRVRPGDMEVQLRTRSSATAALSLLNLPPFAILSKSTLTPGVAEGEAVIEADIGFNMKRPVKVEDVDFAVAGTLTDVVSDSLVAPRRLRAESLRLTASPRSVEIGGALQLGEARAEGSWQQLLGPGHGGSSRIDGVAVLDEAFMQEFGLDLPPGTLSGAGRGQFEVALARGESPAFSLTSDLNALGLSIPGIGWSKPRNATGRLEIAGSLGAVPKISTLEFSAPGLAAEGGAVALKPDGGLETLSFRRVRLGGWLDAPVRLTGRGRGVPPAIAITGGSADIRRAQLGGGGSGGGPIEARLDRLTIAEGIALSPFNGSFTTRGGFQGRFTAQVNGGTGVTGDLAPTPRGPAIRLQSGDAGGVLRDAGIFRAARGGPMALTLNPAGGRGVYDGVLRIEDTRIVDAPAMTELLSAISVVGLIDQLNGPGIGFTDVDADFRLDPGRLTLLRGSATGPSLGVSLDGIYDLGGRRLDMQGVISPVYFLNGIGQIFTRRGEGLLGFAFNLRGDAARPQVQVNPLSILTPGMFREIFRRPPPQVSTE